MLPMRVEDVGGCMCGVYLGPSELSGHLPTCLAKRYFIVVLELGKHLKKL